MATRFWDITVGFLVGATFLFFGIGNYYSVIVSSIAIILGLIMFKFLEWFLFSRDVYDWWMNES